MKQKLDQKQVQKIILAPALQQAIKLLPLTNLELIEVINEELSQNPVLELEEVTAEPSGTEVRPREEMTGAARGEAREESPADLAPEESKEPFEGSEEFDFQSYFHEYIDDGLPSFQAGKKEMPSIANTLTRTPSLWDHLNWQANLTFFDEREREIAQFIIGNINEDGYLTVPVEEIAQQSGVSTEEAEKIREIIKDFDPVGSGCLDLKEVLLTQMDYLQINDEITRAVVLHHLPLLEKSDFAQVARLLGISLQDLKCHLDVIRTLDPTPGRKYSQEKTLYVVPDIIVTKEGGELKVSLSYEGLPRLRISNYYRRLLAGSSKENPDAYHFIKDRMKKALWFLRSLDQRNQTIYKVAKFIVEKQRDFIEKGMDYIKPMILMEVAQEIGVHESTVGRVVANKHILTPRGTYSLKYFFHKSLVGDYGEEISSLKIKERIRKLVENEDKNQPLSDIEIGDILARENLKIARRTVAKYRKQLNILPSYIRKRKFQMEGTS